VAHLLQVVGDGQDDPFLGVAEEREVLRVDAEPRADLLGLVRDDAEPHLGTGRNRGEEDEQGGEPAHRRESGGVLAGQTSNCGDLLIH